MDKPSIMYPCQRMDTKTFVNVSGHDDYIGADDGNDNI